MSSGSAIVAAATAAIKVVTVFFISILLQGATQQGWRRERYFRR
jgi:hypothetical protein